MYFVDKIKKFKEDLIIFVDMDGVIAEYNLDKDKYNYRYKRPLISNIKVLEELSKLENVELHILSICKVNTDIKDKNDWLDECASFFKYENRVVISKEKYPNIASKDLKLNYLQEFVKTTDKKVILIDDDNMIIKYIIANLRDKVLLFQDSSLID